MLGIGSPLKSLIITADDFGVSPGVNRAIVETFRNGSITCASLITNVLHSDEAARLAQQYNIPVGIHLCLTSGRPLSLLPRVPSIIDKRGFFLDRNTLIRRLLMGRITMGEVIRELEAQVALFLDLGLKPDHVNSDQHVHVLPGINKIVTDLAKTIGVPLRIPSGRLFFRRGRIWVIPYFMRKVALHCWAEKLRSLCRLSEVPYNDHFISIFSFLPYPEPQHYFLEKLLTSLEDGTTELMVHPGYHDQLLSDFWGQELLSLQREKELMCLLSPGFRKLLMSPNFHLASFRTQNDIKARNAQFLIR